MCGALLSSSALVPYMKPKLLPLRCCVPYSYSVNSCGTKCTQCMDSIICCFETSLPSRPCAWCHSHSHSCSTHHNCLFGFGMGTKYFCKERNCFCKEHCFSTATFQTVHIVSPVCLLALEFSVFAVVGHDVLVRDAICLVWSISPLNVCGVRHELCRVPPPPCVHPPPLFSIPPRGGCHVAHEQ